ncbi:MAG: VCBS repeat-containing protein [Flavobacteriales bacterium]|nr:VCBS repeat-containing protein [Flavobacteriales bacterium]MCB9193963.1 VCBS repeat-containing protein [Flavobacteriales bacterium]
MRSADLDSNGYDDLIIGLNTNAVERHLWYYPNSSTGLGAAQVIGQTAPVLLSQMEVADVDNDNDLDILYSTNSLGSDCIGVFFNQGGSFMNVELYCDQVDWKDMVEADFDNDGYKDLAAISTDSLYVLRNNGNSMFATSVSIAVGTGLQAIRLAVLDADGDPYPDLLVTFVNSRNSVVLGNVADGTIGFSTVNTMPYSALDLQPADTIPGTFAIIGYGDGGIIEHVLDQQSGTWTHHQISYEVPPRAVHYADWDGDGLVDLLMPTEWGSVLWFRNLGEGLDFDRPQLLCAPVQGDIAKVETADMDGDQDLDLVLEGYDRMWVVPNLGGNQFGAPTLAWYYSGPYDPHAVTDLDNDGDPDIIQYSAQFVRVQLNDGTGHFTYSTYSNSNINDVAFTDRDGDGLIDVLCAASAPNRLAWMQNLGGTFGQMQTIQTTPNEIANFLVGDMDGDGDDDLITAGSYPVQWMRNNGVGYDPLDTLSTLNILIPNLRDVDHDGVMDVFNVLDGAYTMFWQRNLGNAVMDPLGTPIPTSPRFYGVLGWAEQDLLGDLNGDGDLDLAYCGSEGPGGTYDLILSNNLTVYNGLGGSVFIDEDSDGVHAPDEPGVAWRHVVLGPSNVTRLSDAQGSYRFELGGGSYSLTCPGVWDPAIWHLSLGSGGYAIALPPDSSIQDLDFGLAPLLDSGLVDVSVTLGPAPCSGITSLWVSLQNHGSRIEAGDVIVELDPLFTFVSSTPSPDLINGNTLTYAFDSLNFFSTSGVDLQVQMPPAADIGADVSTIATVLTVDSLGMPSGTYSDSLQFVLACSYDPNNKQVVPAGYGASGAVSIDQEQLEYTVHFQNTGNATAHNVRIEDALPAGVDPTSLELVAYSHAPTDVRIDGNMLTIDLLAIMLADSGTSFVDSQGYVRFRCALVPGQPNLTTIDNEASIFFDYNPPIVTDTAHTTLVDCALWMPQITLATFDELEATPGDAYQWYLNGNPIPGANGATLNDLVNGTYTVEVTSEYGCMELTQEYEVISVSVPDGSSTRFMLSPNPAHDHVVLHSSEALSPACSIALLDVQGRELHVWEGNGMHDLVLHYPEIGAGVYLLRIKCGSVVCATLRTVVR